MYTITNLFHVELTFKLEDTEPVVLPRAAHVFLMETDARGLMWKSSMTFFQMSVESTSVLGYVQLLISAWNNVLYITK